MKIKWLGHAAFLITSASGARFMTDPYEAGAYGGAIGYGPINEPAHVITVSHEHGDHGNYKAIKGVDAPPTVVKELGYKAFKTVPIVGIASHHDPSQGSQRGPNTIFTLSVDTIKICHLGDLGHALTEPQLRSIGSVDILLIPVGGNFTIDAAQAKGVVAQLKPKVVIPMHYKTERCNLPIAGVDPFLQEEKNVRRVDGSEVEYSKQSLPKEPQVVVLKPAL